jgi:hypothetical protein
MITLVFIYVYITAIATFAYLIGSDLFEPSPFKAIVFGITWPASIPIVVLNRIIYGFD